MSFFFMSWRHLSKRAVVLLNEKWGWNERRTRVGTSEALLTFHNCEGDRSRREVNKWLSSLLYFFPCWLCYWQDDQTWLSRAGLFWSTGRPHTGPIFFYFVHVWVCYGYCSPWHTRVRSYTGVYLCMRPLACVWTGPLRAGISLLLGQKRVGTPELEEVKVVIRFLKGKQWKDLNSIQVLANQIN